MANPGDHFSANPGDPSWANPGDHEDGPDPGDHTHATNTPGETRRNNKDHDKDHDIEPEPEPPPLEYLRPNSSFNGHHPDTGIQPYNASTHVGPPTIIDLKNLVRRTYIRAKEPIDKHDTNIQQDPTRANFRVTHRKKRTDEVMAWATHRKERTDEAMTCNETTTYIANDGSQDVLRKYKPFRRTSWLPSFAM